MAPGADAGTIRLEPGSFVAGRYRIRGLHASSGMSLVYRARDTHCHSDVVLKFLRSEHLRNQRLSERFRREAQLGAGLASPHLLTPVDFGLWEAVPYLVMPLLEGEDLRRRLQSQGRLTLPRAASLVLDFCRGLHLAHARGLVHRDIKPSNLFIASSEPRERGVLLDFGVAKFAQQEELTLEGTLLGTVGYAAPEQIMSSRAVDARADIYSLGLVLAESALGESVFEGDRAHVLYEMLHGPAPEARIRGRLPAEITALVGRASARDPEDRFSSVAELAAALSPFAGQAFSPGRELTASAPSPNRPELTEADPNQDANPAGPRRRGLSHCWLPAGGVAATLLTAGATLGEAKNETTFAGLRPGHVVMRWPSQRADESAASPPADEDTARQQVKHSAPHSPAPSSDSVEPGDDSDAEMSRAATAPPVRSGGQRRKRLKLLELSVAFEEVNPYGSDE